VRVRDINKKETGESPLGGSPMKQRMNVWCTGERPLGGSFVVATGGHKNKKGGS